MPFDKNNISYRNTCKDCECERYCYFDPADKMFNRKCYVDYIAQKMKIEKIKKHSDIVERFQFVESFKSECFKVCSNEDELCDIVLDICYVKEKSKQFAWDICGNTILKNLLKHNNNKIHYPQLVREGGEFTYCGKQFVMCEKELEAKSDDYFE